MKVKKLVEFYIETWGYGDIKVINNKTGEGLQTKISSHPRGVLVSFIDNFDHLEKKLYSFKEIEKEKDIINSRIYYSVLERVKDIINDYFKISYKIGEGITSFYNKEDKEMLLSGDAKFFTPIYENTSIKTNIY